jgi:hypothetical protein
MVIIVPSLKNPVNKKFNKVTPATMMNLTNKIPYH